MYIMKTMSETSFIPFIIATLNEASRIANRNFGQVTTSTTKAGDNNQVLTETDIAIGSLIIERIESAYPAHNIIDEEAGVIDRHSNLTWVVDPIDGTSNFAQGLPTYGVMMGLLENDRPIAGGIVLPAFDQVYVAQKGQGATCNGQQIHVSTQTELLSSLVAYGIDGHQEDPQRTTKEVALLGKIVLGIRNLRSTNSAYDMAQVCAGRYGVFANQTTKIWDNIAIQPIIEEAGGIVTDFWGQPMDYAQALTKVDQNFTICAGAPALHQQLQAIIHSN